ncbi:MAG: endonuclease/exonuclease/phosphatase family protein [Planctomycetes bacterium]|nr:endonuclease/exonuclease/phosphatase family protein [Planctomycetota bacterium]
MINLKVIAVFLSILATMWGAANAQQSDRATSNQENGAQTVEKRTASIALSVDSGSQVVDVYLFAGQSNMQGIGRIADLPVSVPKKIPFTYFWNQQEFEPLVLSKTKVSTRLTEFGPEVGFALATARAHQLVYIVKYYASGMPLHSGWDGNNWIGDEGAPGRRNFYPGKNQGDTNMGRLYIAMRKEFLNAIQSLKNAGVTPKVRGIIWMQGEQDSKQQVSASNYAANLKLLRQRLAEDLNVAEDLPMVFGQVLPHDPPLERFTHRDEIRAQMAASDFRSGKPEAMNNTVMVSTDGLSLLPDTVHYDAAGQLELGTQFGKAMKGLCRTSLRVMTFNILQAGGEASNVGFNNSSFDGSRMDELAAVIRLANADVVGVQEDCTSDDLLRELGDPWYRVGSIYSRLPLTKVSVEPYLTVAKVELTKERSVTIVNCHWFPPKNGYGPDLAQAELRAQSDLSDASGIAHRIIEKCAVPQGPSGYEATVQPIEKAMENQEAVILTGDFNEPSHLDWTERYAKEGTDRWVVNPTGKPLRFAIDWPGSKRLASIGMQDSYRAIHPNEVERLGVTWTPPYPEKAPGRRNYGDQVLDRIDRVYHAGTMLYPVAAEVVGEATSTSDIVFPGRWPSDHRAVVINFRIE